MQFLNKLKVLAVSTVLLMACNTGKETPVVNDSTTAPGDKLPPVETEKPNSDYPPAFEGQTRVAGVKTTTAYNATKIGENIGSPWAVVPMPDGRLMITDKNGGFMQIFSSDGVLEKKVEGLPKVDNSGQGGLLDVAFDPDFSSNKTLYWTFSEEQQGGGNLMALAKGTLSANENKVENVQVIFRATPKLKSNLHYGSRIVFDKNGDMFVSTGERSILEGRAQAPLLNSNLGKIFHLTKEGKPVATNPFINQPGANPEIYSYGHRNAQGLAFHPVTGDLWENEFGPRGGDELNIIKPGKNYGWPTITYGIEYGGEKISNGNTKKDGLEQPVYYWDPVLSPSGMDFYAGDAIPEWKNNLFIGGLSSMHIARLVIENNKVVGEERLLTDKKERFRDVTYHPNGYLYAVTDQGSLFKIGK